MNAIYARQSVDKKDSMSIETQIDLCKKEIGNEEYKVYSDKGFSGKDTHRPDFENMINDIKSGLINKVIVYKLDRISRSVLDFSNIINIFEKNNVSFISSTEKFDTNTPIGKAMLNIIMVFAQLERETIQMRIKDNYYARGEKGFFMGGRTPYGFNKIKTQINGIKTSTFEHNSIQTSVIAEMFELYSNPKIEISLSKIAKYFNDKNIPSASGSKWDSNKISLILRNPLYVRANSDVFLYFKNKGCNISNDISDFIGTNGCYLYGKREKNERKFTNLENHVLSLGLHEGIIDSDTWLTCQYKLDSNKQLKNEGRGQHSWLSGIIKCGQCNYALIVVNTRGYKYFTCSGKTNLKICDGFSNPIHVERIEKYVEMRLKEKIKNIEHETIDKKTDDFKINQIKIEISKIDQQIENLINQVAQANDVVIKYINKKITELDKEKSILLEEIKKNYIESNKQISTEEIILQLNNWDKLNIDKKKFVSHYFINKVIVYNNKEIGIQWKV